MSIIHKIQFFLKLSLIRTFHLITVDVYFGRSLACVPGGSIVFLPLQDNLFCCGLAGIISFKPKADTAANIDSPKIMAMVKEIEANIFNSCKENNYPIYDQYLGGSQQVTSLKEAIQGLRKGRQFADIFMDKKIQEDLSDLATGLNLTIDSESEALNLNMGLLKTTEAEVILNRIEEMKDCAWCLSIEILENIDRVKGLMEAGEMPVSQNTIMVFRKVNAVLNSIDRLEVRGRDSAGISLMFIMAEDEYQNVGKAISEKKLGPELDSRSHQDVLVDKGISLRKIKGENGKGFMALTFVYKVAAEIGRLGDNVNYLRDQIKHDAIFQVVARVPHNLNTVSAHTRWASVGAITEPNCHPVDNSTGSENQDKMGAIHVCLNGDIDNYMALKEDFQKQGNFIHREITTDTKIIPLEIEKFILQGFSVEEAFRLAVNRFEGSHAISMHTDLAPGKLFLAQKGSGQAVFVGIAEDHYMPTSEVYGFVEETPKFLKMDGEKIVDGKNGDTQGQIFILDQMSEGGLEGITAFYYDSTPVALSEKDIKYTHITSRDIDRQAFPHYFLKEISESPVSVEKTLQNRWKINNKNRQLYDITLDETVVPASVKNALIENKIKRVFFVGQGTAGIAAQACADILNYYMNDPGFNISALKASELSGFKLGESDDSESMADTLMIAISQSGTTTDTNKTVDMVRERGGLTLAIVNRRDSDITFKVHGVIYTSSGRDIEMSVASTKAFYSQIVAGAILGLYISGLKGNRDKNFITEEIKQLLLLPKHMRKILSMKDAIEASAMRLAVTRTYWAAVGSGPNKASADEIRIKLSELCYKTISSDFVEDKKHIDLSSEPLIIVCAAGTRSSVIGDIVKDTAIFQAHKAIPIVIADEGEDRFTPFAEDVFHVPVVGEHLAPIVNTLVGHIWGYYAALAINKGSSFLYTAREDIKHAVDQYTEDGLDIFEIVLEKSFREKIAGLYTEFRSKKAENYFSSIMGIKAATDLILLLKYLSGRLPVTDYELDFGEKGTAFNMIGALFNCLGEAINIMARPVDAIKHQAKTVTVGTSRIVEDIDGILFNALKTYNIKVSQLTNKNVIVLRNLQAIVSDTMGAILYRIDNLNLLGEPIEETTIQVLKKDGVLKSISSRVETDNRLVGTKLIILREGNVYIGKGRKDDRTIIVIPLISMSSLTPNIIDQLLLLNISFKENISLPVKKKALGGKFERIKNIVQENSVDWDDQLIEMVEMEELFGGSAEKIGEFIVSKTKLEKD